MGAVLIASGALLVRSERHGLRLLVAGLLVGAIVTGAWFVPSWTDAYRHDRNLRTLERVLCDPPPAPLDARVISCRGGRVANPSNGNSCGYPVTLIVATHLPIESVSSFYKSVGLDEVLAHSGLTLVETWAEIDGDGLVRVDLLAIGDRAWTCDVADRDPG
jgi:hypothetical protein